MADNKFAAYICSGCGIGDTLEVAATGEDRQEGRQDGGGQEPPLPVQRRRRADDQ